MGCLRPIWVLLAFLSIGLAEPTPQPSIEPTTTTVAATSTVSSTTESSDLAEEGQDQVAILKQINRVNDDGSYTFGYEAADGSFKIETRDVAGNVKGMFGFVDEGGELKRVSYSASNGTGFQSTGSPNVPSLISSDDIESSTRLPISVSSQEPTTRISLFPTSTTERTRLPVYIYKSTTRAPRPEVIQHIPKLRPTPGSINTEPTESEEITNIRRPTHGTQLPRKSSTPNYISLKSTTPQAEEEEPDRSGVVQAIRPRGYKKVLVTKRPFEASTTPTVPSTTDYYPVTYAPQLNEEVTGHNDIQRQVDSNSVTEGGLLTSGTEDSPDVFGGGPTPRPYPAGAYRALFPQLPQYQRILQSSYSQNPNQYGGPPGPQPPLPGQNYGQYNPAAQGPINQGIPNRFQDPAAIAQYAQFLAGRNQQVPYPPEAQSPDVPYPQDPGAPPVPPNRPPIIPQNYGQNIDGNQQYPPIGPLGYRPSQRPNIGFRRPQTLPTPSYNPAQGLGPDGPVPNAADAEARRPYPDPAQYNPNQPPYGPPQGNPQNYFMETLLRMLIAAQSQTRQQPPLSPFQQALLSTLGANNVPPELLGQGYDPRSSYQNYGQYQQRAPYYQQPQYDPRYSQYSGYPDQYSQSQYPNRYNPYYQQPPYQGYNQNPYQGYSPNPYYQQRPEELLLQMFLGSRFAPPAPQTNSQIQTSPGAFDNPANIPRGAVRGPIRPDVQGPIYGQKIPVGSNIVERSSPYTNKETSPYQRARSKGSRNVQILEPTASESSTTTSKP